MRAITIVTVLSLALLQTACADLFGRSSARVSRVQTETEYAGEPSGSRSEVNYTYDDVGHPVEIESENDGQVWRTLELTWNGNEIEEIEMDAGSQRLQFEMTWESGLLVKMAASEDGTDYTVTITYLNGDRNRPESYETRSESPDYTFESTLDFEYDELNRLSRIESSSFSTGDFGDGDESTTEINFSWDDNGQLVEVENDYRYAGTNSRDGLEFEYDSAGRLEQTDRVGDDLNPSREEIEYGDDGRMAVVERRAGDLTTTQEIDYEDGSTTGWTHFAPVQFGIPFDLTGKAFGDFPLISAFLVGGS